eukprot:3936169-Rhodomonas_salina.1
MRFLAFDFALYGLRRPVPVGSVHFWGVPNRAVLIWLARYQAGRAWIERDKCTIVHSTLRGWSQSALSLLETPNPNPAKPPPPPFFLLVWTTSSIRRVCYAVPGTQCATVQRVRPMRDIWYGVGYAATTAYATAGTDGKCAATRLG